MNTIQLENRLVDFAVEIINLQNTLYRTYAGRQISHQITRAAISSALNYGESRHAESRKDFRHKIKLVVKELKEVQMGLRICFKAKFITESSRSILDENDELVAIFVSTSKTLSKALH